MFIRSTQGVQTNYEYNNPNFYWFLKRNPLLKKLTVDSSQYPWYSLTDREVYSNLATQSLQGLYLNGINM